MARKKKSIEFRYFPHIERERLEKLGFENVINLSRRMPEETIEEIIDVAEKLDKINAGVVNGSIRDKDANNQVSGMLSRVKLKY